jgi:hypothetical protein
MCTERAKLEKKPSMRLSQEPWMGGELEAAGRSRGEPTSGLLRCMSGMIVENHLNRGAGRIGVIKEPEEFDELAAALAVSDEGMNLPSEQINPSQQA